MNKILSIIILSLLYCHTVLADNVRNYEIEGMSIGDSLLNFMSKSEIKNNEIKYFANKKKYYVVGILDNLNTYDQVEIYLKSNDKKYKIEQITAMIFIDNLEECLLEKKKIIKSFGSSLVNLEKNSTIIAHSSDKTGKSKQYQDSYWFNKKKSNIRIECVQWSQKMKEEKEFISHLNVSAASDKITSWINNGYK